MVYQRNAPEFKNQQQQQNFKTFKNSLGMSTYYVFKRL